jgi:hypothetical protein
MGWILRNIENGQKANLSGWGGVGGLRAKRGSSLGSRDVGECLGEVTGAGRQGRSGPEAITELVS